MSVITEQNTYLNFINGEWVKSQSGDMVKVVNPADVNDIVGYVQNSTAEDVERAVAAANEAKTAWRKLTGAERGQFYTKQRILWSGAWKTSPPAQHVRWENTAGSERETARGIAILRYYAGEGMRKTGDVIPSTDKDALMFTTRVPLGVVGVISPWNFPVAIPIWKMAPALVYGNTVVIKPATETAVTCAKIIACFEEAGLPAGVINLVTGPGSVVGQGLAEHDGVNAVTFTGSNQVGKIIGQAAFARGAKYQLEMGGKTRSS